MWQNRGGMRHRLEIARRLAGAVAFAAMLAALAVSRAVADPPCFVAPGLQTPASPMDLPVDGGDRSSAGDPVCPALAPAPTWVFAAEGGGMLRSPSHSVNFAAFTPPVANATPTIVVSTGQLPYDFATTGTFCVARSLSDCLQIEGLYTGTVPTSSSEAARDNSPNLMGGAGNLFSPFSDFGTAPINGLDYNKYAAINYTSALHSVELNLRRQLNDTVWDGKGSLLVGIRYVGLPEDLSYQTVSDVTSSGAVVPNGAINNIHVSTSNEMIGAQVGCLCQFLDANGWCLNVGAKGALLNNHCGETSSYMNINNGTTTGYLSSQAGDHTSLAGELNVSLSHCWSRHFTGWIGYQGLWLTGTALAQDNFNTNIQFYENLDTQLTHNTVISYHEIYLGAELAW